MDVLLIPPHVQPRFEMAARVSNPIDWSTLFLFGLLVLSTFEVSVFMLLTLLLFLVTSLTSNSESPFALITFLFFILSLLICKLEILFFEKSFSNISDIE